MTYQRVMLKVCEGCGTLWIRKQAMGGVYCGPCTEVFEHFPDPKTRLRPGRPKKQRPETGFGGALPAFQTAGGAL